MGYHSHINLAGVTEGNAPASHLGDYMADEKQPAPSLLEALGQFMSGPWPILLFLYRWSRLSLTLFVAFIAGGIALMFALYLVPIALAATIATTVVFAIATLALLDVFISYINDSTWKDSVPMFLRKFVDSDYVDPNISLPFPGKHLSYLINNKMFITIAFTLMLLSLINVAVLPLLMATGVLAPSALLFTFGGSLGIFATIATISGLLMLAGVVVLMLAQPRLQDLIRQTVAEKKTLLLLGILFVIGALTVTPLLHALIGFSLPGLGVAGLMVLFSVTALIAAVVVYTIASRSLGEIAVAALRLFAMIGSAIVGPSRSVPQWLATGYHHLIAIISGASLDTVKEHPGFVETYLRLEPRMAGNDSCYSNVEKAGNAFKNLANAALGFDFNTVLSHTENTAETQTDTKNDNEQNELSS